MKREDLLALLVNRLSSDFIITDVGHGWSNKVITVKSGTNQVNLWVDETGIRIVCMCPNPKESGGCNKVVLPENVIDTIISLKGHKCMPWGG
jgi:hypothetical protein